jgi:hypothetical protein
MLVSKPKEYVFLASADSHNVKVNKELSRMYRIMVAGAHLPQRNKVFSRKSKIVYLMVYFMV